MPAIQWKSSPGGSNKDHCPTGSFTEVGAQQIGDDKNRIFDKAERIAVFIPTQDAPSQIVHLHPVKYLGILPVFGLIRQFRDPDMTKIRLRNK